LDVGRVIAVPGGIDEKDEAIILNLQKYYNISASVDGTTNFIITLENQRVVGLYINIENDTAERIHPNHVAITHEWITQLGKVITLHLSCGKVDLKILSQMPSLRHLCVMEGTIWNVRELSKLQSLKTLCLRKIDIMEDGVPEETNEKERQSDKRKMELLESISSMKSLMILDLEDNYPIKELPESIGNLGNLLYLNVNKNSITKLPASISRLGALQTLLMEGQNFTSFPEHVLDLPCLVTLDMGSTYGNKDTFTIPDKLGKLQLLQRLNLQKNTLAGIPPSLQDMPALIDLNLSGATIAQADSFFAAMKRCPSLAKLNLQGIDVRALPPALEQCTQLVELNLSDCGLTEIPPYISAFMHLESLDASSNMLLDLPNSIGSLTRLKKLKLSGNGFLFLPQSISRLVNLEELDVDNNYLTSLPPWLKDIPDLREIIGKDNPWDKRWHDAIVDINELKVYGVLQLCRDITKERSETSASIAASPELIENMDAIAKRDWIMTSARDMLKRQGKKASHLLRCITRKWPDNMESAWAKAHLAFYMSYGSELDKAVDMANQALNQDPKQSVAMVALARINYERKDYDKAESWYRSSLAIEADTRIAATAWNNLGVILRDKGKKQEAKQCFLKAVAVNPEEEVFKENLKR
jgi:Leucine-rich repeat (LRR) protein/predicted negative regulator of RcsB-dependent stress response